MSQEKDRKSAPRQNSPLLFSFGIDQEVLDAFYDLHSEMEGVRFLADPLTLLPFLHQPREPVKVKIDYFQEGCSSTGDCQTTLLWMVRPCG